MAASAGRNDGVREVTPAIPGVIVRYVARAHDRAAAEAALESAGVPDANCLLDERVSLAPGATRWFSSAEAIALADAAARVCGEADIGRRAGEQLFLENSQTGVTDFLVATGSVQKAAAAAVEFGTKMSTGRLLRVRERADRHVVIEGQYADLASAHELYCGLTAGYFAHVPSLFGFVGTMTHPKCQFRGDPCCIFRLAWGGEAAVTESFPDVADSATRSEQQLATFEELEAIAGELVRADDVDDVLRRITERVGIALQAPRYLLAVRTDDGGAPRVHHFGFDDDADAQRAVERVLGGALDEADNVLVLDIVSARRTFGRLAAMHVPGARFTDVDRRLLKAYADHAAAALEVVASLDEARHDRDTARALLGLARDLAEVGTSSEISDRLARAVCNVTDAQNVSVWLWDEDTSRFSLGNRWAATPMALRDDPLSIDELPGLHDWTHDPQPVLVHADDAPSALRDLLLSTVLRSATVMPIVTSGRLLGVVSAGFTHAVNEAQTARLLERLRGVAAHAAIALDNARLIENVRHQALHDALTGLPNRPLVEDRANQVLKARSYGHAGVLFIDLDRFKNVNDTLGHKAGDELIRAVADRLRTAIREGDTLARLGGDEFVVLLPEIAGNDEAAAIADRIIDALAAPLRVAGEQLFISCSVGIACAPDHGTDYGTLLQHADAAMYEAKALGRGRHAMHATAGIDTRRMERLHLESQLHRAVENQELRLYYQPQVDLAAMRTVTVEALVRWEHPTLGLLEPGAFVPLAEETGLIVGIDAWVRHRAFADAAAWTKAGTPLRVAVNVSSRDLMNPNFDRDVAAEIAASGLDPSSVELEITDRVVMDDDALAEALARLRTVGARLAIDDFGTGTSVLGRLHDWPLDTLKIDRRFLCDVDEETVDAPVLKALISLGRSLDLTVVAEGVETQAQLTMLSRYGCDLGQGFVLCPPMPAGATFFPYCDELTGAVGR